MNRDLVGILADHLKSKSSNVPVSPEVISLAQSHQVLPIVYYQTKESTLSSVYFQAISLYVRRNALLEQIKDALSGIPFFMVKGFSVAQYYPVPQLRTMGDCDIIVHECDKEKAKQRLLSIGFVDTTGDWDDMEWHFRKQGLDFELHHRLLYDEVVNTEQEKTFTDTAWDYVHDHELDADFHFVYLLIHLKKHMLNRGVGIRQFMDLAVMSRNAGLNKSRIKSFLQQVGLEKFAGICSALCLHWFEIMLPVDTPEISEDFFARATDTILANGVFGFDVPDDGEKRLLNTVSKSGKLRTIIGSFFPSYRTCCITPKYKWIKGKPYLLPFLWSYRFFWALFHGKSEDNVEHIKSVIDSDEAMNKRNRELSEWGLR